MQTAVLLAYLVAQMLLVVVVARNIHTEKEYFLAGSRLKTGFAAISIFITWFGVESSMGASSAIYGGGLYSSKAEPFGSALCLLLMGLFLAKRLWKLRLTTIADIFRVHYKSHLIERITAIILIPGTCLWAGAQIRAFGHVLHTVTPISFEWSLICAVLIVMMYALWGGLIGDVITGVVQGTILTIGLALTLGFLIYYYYTNDLSFASALTPERLSLISPGESVVKQVDVWAAPILGALITQEIMFRIVGSHTPRIARNSCLIAAAIYLVVGLIPVGIGLLGTDPSLGIGQLKNPDNFMIVIAYKMLPETIALIFSGALIASILATIDGTLLSVSALTTHNIFGRAFYKQSDRRQLWYARLVVFLGGIVAFFIALLSDNIYELVIKAAAFGSAGLLVVLFIALYLPKFGNAPAAIVTLLVGLCGSIAQEFFPDALPAPYLTTVAVCLVVYTALSRLKGNKRLT
jgi:SSS family solute:Na+ symporter